MADDVRKIFGPHRDWGDDYVPVRRPLTHPPQGPPRWMVRALIGSAILLVVFAATGMYLRFRPTSFNPERWQVSGGIDRARMLTALFEQTDFADFTRAEVEHYLGPPDYDERQFWYDLGLDTTSSPTNARATVGDADRLYGVFHHDADGEITQVFYSRRRPVLGSVVFDSSAWFSGGAATRRTMFTNALGRLRSLGLSYSVVQSLLGPSDGHRVRAQYNVGRDGVFFGSPRALVVEYDDRDVVMRSWVTE